MLAIRTHNTIGNCLKCSPPLMAATYDNNTALMELLFQHDANIDMGNKDGLTALHLTAKRNHLDAARLLLKHNTDTRIKDRFWSTAMDYAREYRRKEMEEILSERQTP